MTFATAQCTLTSSAVSAVCNMENPTVGAGIRVSSDSSHLIFCMPCLIAIKVVRQMEKAPSFSPLAAKRCNCRVLLG